MFDYIFSSLRASEESLRNVHRVLKCQNLINRRFALFTMATAAGFVVLGAHIQAQNEIIKKLGKEIKRMQEPTEGCTESTESEK